MVVSGSVSFVSVSCSSLAYNAYIWSPSLLFRLQEVEKVQCSVSMRGFVSNV